MTLYKCGKCRRWNSGIAHFCGDPLPEIRDSNSLKSAVVREARALIEDVNSEGYLEELDFDPLERALLELDGLDRPLEQ